MTEMLIALVPLAVGLVPVLRWPTRERRIRKHLQLLKEVPDGIDASGLRSLVQDELKDLAALDRAGMTRTRRQARRELAGRALHAALSLFVLVPFLLMESFQSWFAGLPAEQQFVVAVYGLVGVVLAQWTISGYAFRVAKWRAARRRSAD